MFLLFAHNSLADFYEGKLTTFYHQISREEAEDLGIWPKIAFCVPYSGKYYSISEMTGKNAINVSSRSRMDFIDFLPVKCINEDV